MHIDVITFLGSLTIYIAPKVSPFVVNSKLLNLYGEYKFVTIELAFKNKPFNLDFVREIIEQAAIVYNSKKSGILELGGGVPKNTAQQTGPLLDQILRKDHGGQDYIIQITDARPDTGGLSGATLQEGKSWGKVQDSHEDLITVYTDSTIAFPLLALYALSNEESREQKRIYKNLDKYYKTLQDSASKVPDKFADILKKSDINLD